MKDRTIISRRGSRVSVLVKFDLTKIFVGLTWMDLRNVLPDKKAADGGIWLFICPIPLVCINVGFG